jgi:cytochrome c553
VALSAARQSTPVHAQAQAAPTELPAGPAKAVIERACTVCHGVDYILTKKASAQEWENTVNTMVSRGADLSDAEIPVVVKYLATNFPDAKAAPPAGGTTPAAPATPAKP